jgi:hypothetical protein
MTGRELILYILQNNLENESVFKDGRFLGFLSAEEFAVKNGVGVETVRMWVDYGYVEGIVVYDEIYIPANANVKKPTQEVK